MTTEGLEKSYLSKDQVEDLGYEKTQYDVDHRTSVPTPLLGLTPEEHQKITRSATLKMDLIIMPCLVVMYIMVWTTNR
jgi:hypothetical protein